MIVVEGADRFGLAALHQLRGRVGRGTRPSSCYLVSSEASERLAILEHSHNGFRIAEADLIHRCEIQIVHPSLDISPLWLVALPQAILNPAPLG